MSEQGDDKFLRVIAAMTAMGQAVAGGAESQIHTQEAINLRSRFVLQLFHGLGVFLAFVGFVGGLYLFSFGIDWLLDLGWDPRFYLTAWVLFICVVIALTALVRRVLTESGTMVQAFVVVALLMFFGVAAGSLALTARERFGWELVGMVVGGALILSCPAFGFNQLSDLLNPYWRRSPYEQELTKQLLPPLAEFLRMEDGEKVGETKTEDPRWMQRKGQEYGVVARPMGVQDPAVEDWGSFADEDEELVKIAPEAGNLIWFVRYAAQVPSLSISDLTMRPAPLLPFQEDGKDKYLRRDMIRRLIARGSTSGQIVVDRKTEHGLGAGGFWEIRGQGVTPAWVMERDEAKRKALEMWRNVYGDELPVPDYFRDRDLAA